MARKRRLSGQQPMQIQANEQAFQTLFLASEPDSWKEKIVFLDPVQESEIAGVAALKSMDLESLDGLVLAAPYAVLREFRSRIGDIDQAEGLGKLSNNDILARLFKEASDCGLTLVYQQRASSLGFFDPLTKKGIVEEGPHYFDKSLPSLKNMEDLSENKSAREVADSLSRKREAVSNHLMEMCRSLRIPKVDCVFVDDSTFLVSFRQKFKKSRQFANLLKKNEYSKVIGCFSTTLDGVSIVFSGDDVFTSYSLSESDTKALFGLQSQKQIISSLLDFSNRWCKTGAIKGAFG